jgi:hypothetical protein
MAASEPFTLRGENINVGYQAQVLDVTFNCRCQDREYWLLQSRDLTVQMHIFDVR